MEKLLRALMIMMGLLLVLLSVSFAVPAREQDIPLEPMPDDELIHIVEPPETPVNVQEEAFWDTDVHWLAMALDKESGVNWPDCAIIMIGDVIMHRVHNSAYPNTIKEVLLDPGQYEPFEGDFVPYLPGQRYIDLAKRILNGESCLTDEDILYQALFPQENITVVTYYDEVLGTTTYFCK